MAHEPEKCEAGFSERIMRKTTIRSAMIIHPDLIALGASIAPSTGEHRHETRTTWRVVQHR